MRRDKNFKRARLIAIILLILVFVGIGATTVFHNLVELPREYKKELPLIKSAAPGDVVRFGRYDTDYLLPGDERLEWIVLNRSGNDIMLITKEGIASATYLNSHAETDWNNSDLCKRLNQSLYNQIFSDYEKGSIIANPDTGDMLSLLSVREALTCFADDAGRQISITSVAEKEGTNINTLSKVNYWDSKGYRSSWWWLRGDESPSITAPIVSVDGTVLENGRYVNKPNGALRPVVWLHVE